MVYYINENFSKDVKYTVNKFFTHKFDEEHILITTSHGSWVVLSNEEFDLLMKNKIHEDSYLFDVLEGKGIIITEKNTNEIVNKYKQRFDYLSNGIGLHIVVPTLRCNHQCIYCHSLSKDMDTKCYDMDEDIAKAVVDFIFQSPSKSINLEFQGGEPLVNFPIVQYIVEYAKEKNNSKYSSNVWYSGNKQLSFTIVTNLTLMDEEILNYILKNRIRICTSLDGPKELHDKNRPCKNYNSSYEEVTHWIDIIKKKDPTLTALPTITRYSLNYAKEIVDEYMKHKFTHLKMRELNIAGMSIKSWNTIGYTPEEYIKFWKEYFEYLLTINRSLGIKLLDQIARSILTRIMCRKSTFDACLNSPCGVGTVQCAYNEKGDVYTCDEARSNETFKLGNVKENNYKDVFTSENVSSFISLSSCLSFLCDSCTWNSYCSPCLVSGYGETKTLIPKFPNFVCKIRGEQTKEIFKKLIFSKDKYILEKWMSYN